MRYVIIYTNDRTVQEHRVYYLGSRVNVLLQKKVQRVTSTYHMQVLTIVLYHSGGLIHLSVNFNHVGICWNLCLKE